MENLIFERTHFPKAPGGDRYGWKQAETTFEISKNGRYVIAITASCKNGKQNNTGDDDDLRASINGYEFGRAEAHAEKISYQGFGTSASWDGASLKGGTKTVYFFLELDEELEKLFWFNQKRQHVIKFYADNKPQLESIEVFQLEQNESFVLEKQKPNESLDVNKKGIPWMSFVFLGVRLDYLEMIANCKSGKQKNSKDGDNIKLLINGEILKNQKALASDKYKNFYFSGDQMHGEKEKLILKAFDFPKFENALELWYDETPILENFKIDFFKTQKDFFKDLLNWNIKARRIFYYTFWQFLGVVYWKFYTEQFLLHSLQENPQPIIFDCDDPIVNEIKKDKKAYDKIINLIKGELKNNKLQGEIILGNAPETEINFETKDLKTALHGVKKIKYNSTHIGDDIFDVEIEIIDIYDFDPEKHSGYISLLVNMADRSEIYGVIKNFQITIKIKENLTLDL